MRHSIRAAGLAAAALGASIAPAAAHHVMGGRMPATWSEGLLSGLAHPVIGFDHFAAVVAIGCLAALHRRGAMLVIGYVLVMMLGVAVHVRGVTVPGDEILVALSVLALGAVMLWRPALRSTVLMGLFALTGLLHGYALGESIAGAEPTPLYSYFVGLAVIQTVVALGAYKLARIIAVPGMRTPMLLRGAGAVVALVGVVALVQQLAGAA